MNDGKNNKRSRNVVHNGVHYQAAQETTARDGGDPPRWWYWTRIDSKYGACIDDAVPGGYFKTLSSARRGLGSFLSIEVAS